MDREVVDREAELQETVRALTARQEAYRRLLDSLPLKVYYKDRELRFLLVNKAFATELGVAPEDVIGKTDFDFHPKHLAEHYRADDQWVMKYARPVTSVVRYEGQGGETIVEVTKAAVMDELGRPSGVVGIFSDVTERVRAEDELRHERFLLSSMMDHGDDHIYFKDAASRFVRVNQAMARWLRVREPDDVVGKTDFDFFAREHAEAAFRDEQEILSTGRSIVSREEKETWPDGRVTWVLTSKMPLRDPAGRIMGTFGVSRDITNRKMVEVEFHRQRRILQSVLDSIADSVVVIDADGLLILFNPAARRLFRLGREEPAPGWRQDLAGRVAFMASDGSRELPANELPLARALRGEDVDGAELLLHWSAGGTDSRVSVDARPLRDEGGDIVGAVAAMHDVTAQRMAEIALRRSEERYRELFENANDVIYTHDLTGRLTSFNKAGERVTGYHRDEAARLALADLVAPEYLQLAKTMLARKIKGIPTTTYEIEIITKDNRRVPLEVSTRIIYDGGQPIGVQGIARDITEPKRNREALRLQAELLEKQNAELSKAYAELKEAEAQLIHSEKMAAVGQLVAGLAHEINNPAAFVVTNLTVIEQDLADVMEFASSCRKLAEVATRDASLAEQAPTLASELRSAADEVERIAREGDLDETFREIPEMLDAAKRGMGRIRELVANLRSYSRIDVRGDVALADLNEGLRATLTLVAPIVPKGVAIDFRPGEFPLIDCNLGQINQVFMNLIVNAVHAVGARGTVTISAEQTDGGVTVSVADTGPGIPLAIRGRIFDPFFTTKPVGQGTGLGLSIARRIIESHQGRISFETEEGRGTTFRVWLPTRRVTEEAAPAS